MTIGMVLGAFIWSTITLVVALLRPDGNWVAPLLAINFVWWTTIGGLVGYVFSVL